MQTMPMFVIHSAYPDGSWRGLEKCSGTEDGATRLFTTREDAEASVRDQGMTDYFRVVVVTLIIPDVGGALDSASSDKLGLAQE